MGKFTQKRTDGKQMSTSVLENPICPFEMQKKIRELFPCLYDGEKRESRIARAARSLGISFRMAKTYWDREKPAPHIEHFAKVKRLLGEPLGAGDLEHIKEARDELAKLRQRIARLETALAVQDEAFHSEHVAGLQQSLGGLRGVRRPVD